MSEKKNEPNGSNVRVTNVQVTIPNRRLQTVGALNLVKPNRIISQIRSQRIFEALY